MSNPNPNWTDDDWLTPPSLLALLGDFDLDPCTPLVRPWDTAKQHYNIKDNGLRQPWQGRVWMNPPYSAMEPWIDKMLTHRNGMALVNARTETKWFFKGVWDAAHAVLFFKGRIPFVRPDGSTAKTGKSASVIAAYTETDAGILYRAGFEGQFVPLVFNVAHNIRTTWKALIRFLLKECNGSATLEQLYALAHGHPKTIKNSNWKAKIRQQVQREAKRVGPSLWSLDEMAALIS